MLGQKRHSGEAKKDEKSEKDSADDNYGGYKNTLLAIILQSQDWMTEYGKNKDLIWLTEKEMNIKSEFLVSKLLTVSRNFYKSKIMRGYL